MAFLLVILIGAVYIYRQKNKKLKTELRGPDPLVMSDLVISAEENIYEEIGPQSLSNRNDSSNPTLLRTESQVTGRFDRK